jgi:hypothetical protein
MDGDEEFAYDVFLSHNSKDKPAVRNLAERLREDGLRVWFDDWSIPDGGDIFHEIEQGLENSRALVLVISPNTFGSQWVTLERNTALFRDPTNRQRRFVPLLLVDCKIPDTLQRYRYIDFREAKETAYKRLLNACQAQGSSPGSTNSADNPAVQSVQHGHRGDAHEITLSHFGDFKAQLGSAQNTGLLSLGQRLKFLVPNQNPYWTGPGLPANSPVFFGRNQILHQLLAAYRRPVKPPCVSLLGERRIGKSSLLNQVYLGLGQEPELVSIHASAQNWNQASQQNFFQHLYQAIRTTVPDVSTIEVEDYPGLRNAITALSRRYRFLLIIDEFEEMAGNPNFDRFFFSNLRALGDGPEYNFGYLLASRRPLKELCRQHEIQASKFWNIFGTRRVLGLLEESEARDLVVRPITKTLAGQADAEVQHFWEKKIKPLTGCHPALVQIATAEHWGALADGYTVDSAQLEIALREHLEDLWFRCRPEAWQLLIRAAAGQTLPSHPWVRNKY